MPVQTYAQLQEEIRRRRMDPTYDPVVEERRSRLGALAQEQDALDRQALHARGMQNAPGLGFDVADPSFRAQASARPDIDLNAANPVVPRADVNYPAPPPVGIPDTSGASGPHPRPPSFSSPTEIDSDFDDVLSGSSSTGIAEPPRPRAPEFGNVLGGGSSTDPRAHVMGEAAREEPGSLRVKIGGDDWQEAMADGSLPQPGRLASLAGTMWDPADQAMEPVRSASGGGTLSMMTAPENEARVTRASRLQDALEESAIRQAQGLPSELDIFRAQAAQDLRFGPKEQLEFQQAEVAQEEVRRFTQYQADLNRAVQAGRLAPEAAAQLLEDAREAASWRLQAIQGASMSGWAPGRGDSFGDLAALPPGQPG